MDAIPGGDLRQATAANTNIPGRPEKRERSINMEQWIHACGTVITIATIPVEQPGLINDV